MSANSFACHCLISILACVMIGVSGQRKKCFKDDFCFPRGDMKAVCKDGYCVCTGENYDYETCLPDAYGCRIAINSNTTIGKPSIFKYLKAYSCTPAKSSPWYEVHVLAMHSPSGDAIVNVVSHRNSSRPIILVLSNNNPVNWILNIKAGVNISKVLLVAFYIEKSSVKGDTSQVMVIEKHGTRGSQQWASGYGSDAGGGNTVGLLKKLHDLYGVVTSFSGTYRADKWSLVVSSAEYRTAKATSTPTTSAVPGSNDKISGLVIGLGALVIICAAIF